jgi:hypothetical protein
MDAEGIEAGRMKRRRLAGIGVLLGPLLFLPGCQEQDLTVPTAEEAAEYYTAVTDLSVEMAGNVAEVTVVQSTAQLRRGGSLWARVGPYIYLFSEGTRDLFVDFPGLAAVRVITTTSGGTEVARATLLRTTLNELTWRRALNIAGLARRDGTERVTLVEDLVQWGEDRTEHEYNPRYVRR